jgi:hypothetical protein
MSWRRRWREMVLAGGAITTAACGGVTSSPGASDATVDAPEEFAGSGCCNAASDPCCEYLNCGGTLTTDCANELACQDAGGAWEAYPGSCLHDGGGDAIADAGADASGDEDAALSCPDSPPPIGGSCTANLSCSYCDGGALCDCNAGAWECGGSTSCLPGGGGG